MIACYLVYKHEFDAKEAIAWTRLCRPGSVVGQQQQFILDLEPKIGNLVKVSKPKRDYTEYKAGREKVKHCQKKPAENPYKKEVLFKPGKFSANMDALYDEINQVSKADHASANAGHKQAILGKIGSRDENGKFNKKYNEFSKAYDV